MRLKPGIKINIGRHVYALEIPDSLMDLVPIEFLDKPEVTEAPEVITYDDKSKGII